MDKEDLTHKLLKIKGFKEWVEKNYGFGAGGGMWRHSLKYDLILAIVQKWLREEHKIYVDAPLAIYTNQKHAWYLAYRYGSEVRTDGCKDYSYNTYEEALEKGLMEALKLIK